MARVSPQEGAFWARYYWYIVDSFIYLEISRSMIFFIFQTCHLMISTWAAFWFFSNFPKIRFVLAWWAHPMYSEPTLSNFSEDTLIEVCVMCSTYGSCKCGYCRFEQLAPFLLHNKRGQELRYLDLLYHSYLFENFCVM